MKNIFFLLIAGGLTLNGFAQTDTKAKAILDEVSKKTKTYTSIAADFSYTIENKKQNTSEKQDGKLVVKGDKYKLDIANQTVLSDGKVTWTILKESKEVQINNASTSDESVNPSSIFTIYDKGFKYEFVKEETQKDGTVDQIIKLYPLEPAKKNFHTVTLAISKAKKQIKSIRVNGKDGSDITYNVKKFTPNTDVADATFTFNAKTYPGFEVMDLR
jgi:outer membrane lipoprotein-sorting protein